MVLVSPDAERTMNTYLGACVELSRKDIEEDLIKASKIIYLEGYLWDREEAKDALLHTAELAKKHGRVVSLTLSDPFCVKRHRDGFLKLIKSGVSLLFCNEEEIIELFQEKSVEKALARCRDLCDVVVVTRGDKGAVAMAKGKRFEIHAEPIDRVVDTTGAGDMFAAGFLTGYARDKSIPECLKMGALAAGEIISHVGARPQVSLKELVERKVK